MAFSPHVRDLITTYYKTSPSAGYLQKGMAMVGTINRGEIKQRILPMSDCFEKSRLSQLGYDPETIFDDHRVIFVDGATPIVIPNEKWDSIGSDWNCSYIYYNLITRKDATVFGISYKNYDTCILRETDREDPSPVWKGAKLEALVTDKLLELERFGENIASIYLCSCICQYLRQTNAQSVWFDLNKVTDWTFDGVWAAVYAVTREDLFPDPK